MSDILYPDRPNDCPFCGEDPTGVRVPSERYNAITAELAALRQRAERMEKALRKARAALLSIQHNRGYAVAVIDAALKDAAGMTEEKNASNDTPNH